MLNTPQELLMFLSHDKREEQRLLDDFYCSRSLYSAHGCGLL